MTAVREFLSGGYAVQGWWRGNSVLVAMSFGIFAVGVLLLLETSGWLHELGIALLTASVLGIAGGLFLKHFLAAQMAETTFGYILPHQFREQMRWLYNLPFHCVSCTIDVKLQVVDETTVAITTTQHRTLRNITGRI